MKPLFTLLAFFCVQAIFAQTPVELQISKISETKFRWQIEKKLDSLAALMDDQIIIQHGNGRIDNKSNYINSIQSGFLTYNTIDVKEKKISVFGNTALVIGKVLFNVSIKGEKRDFDFGFTEVYAKNGNAWKLVLYAFRNNQ